MTSGARRAIYLVPRILGACMAAFLAIFAFDVFGSGYTAWEAAGAFLIQLVPAFIVAAAVAVAWRWELTGTVLFVALGVCYVVMAWGRFPLVTYLAVSGPLVVTGVLFLVSWIAGRVTGEQASPDS